jgi:hypothetical protein
MRKWRVELFAVGGMMLCICMQAVLPRPSFDSGPGRPTTTPPALPNFKDCCLLLNTALVVLCWQVRALPRRVKIALTSSLLVSLVCFSLATSTVSGSVELPQLLWVLAAWATLELLWVFRPTPSPLNDAGTQAVPESVIRAAYERFTVPPRRGAGTESSGVQADEG